MTVMERNTNSNTVNDSSKFAINNQQQANNNNINQSILNCESSNQNFSILNDENRQIMSDYDTTSRKNSATGSINLGSNSIPASNLSLSSTSSASSSNAYSKQDSPTSNKQFYKSAHSSRHHSTHNSTSSPQTSRRQSGNSITIKIISENNDQIEDDSVIKESDLNTNDEEEIEREREYQKDRDDGEDTTSNSISNDYSPGSHKQKKLKERKKLIRSSIQQQHHLMYQESEDQVEEENQNRFNEVQTFDYPANNMNSAFDELFAAAESGNSSISAMIEAKMAAAAAEAAAASSIHNIENELPLKKTNSVRRSREGSSRSISRNGGSVRVFSRLLPHDRANDSKSTLYDNSPQTPTNNFNNSLKADNYLGSPQQLTRSCSCKRPGSFKKMRSKNASPNRSNGVNSFGAITNETEQFIRNKSNTSRNSKQWATTPTETTSNARRGTQCSITIMGDFNSPINQKAESLPFEPFNQQQLTPTLSTNPEDPSAEIYRVRQFNITNKGSVINRGDSFKRSFKKSNQSLTSGNNNNNNNNNNNTNVKKDVSQNYIDTNTLNLPDYQDGMYLSKSSNSSNYGITETSFSNVIDNSLIDIKVENADNIEVTSPVQRQEANKAYVVYVLGGSTVGKNALIKQFKTSEYRGTYVVSHNQLSEDENDEGVSVMLDGIESRIQFISIDIDMIKPSSVFEITKDNDAFITVYSISDKSSFQVAIDILKSIRTSEAKNQPVILVGNKSDLVRKRSISREDGRYLAFKYGSKFVETSVAINDKVDDLLAGILKQIRLKEAMDKENAYANNLQEIQSCVLESSNKVNKTHSRNFSDAHLHDLISKSSTNNNSNNNSSTQWFKSNTLTRRFFKSKNRDSLFIDNTSKYNSIKQNEINSASSNSGNAGNNSSIFHKIFNTIFKKKSNNSNLQSVENLFTPPATLNKFKKLEK